MALLLLLDKGAKPVPLAGGSLLLALNFFGVKQEVEPERPVGGGGGGGGGGGFGWRYDQYFLTPRLPEKDYSYMYIDSQDSEEELIMTVISILFKTGIL